MWESLLSTDFMTRDCCGSWDESWRIVYMVSHLAITVAYLGIGLVLVLVHPAPLERLPNLRTSQRRHLQVVYGMFIGLCGWGHLEGVQMFYLPTYHAYALLHAATAAVSWWALWCTVRYRSRILVGV